MQFKKWKPKEKIKKVRGRQTKISHLFDNLKISRKLVVGFFLVSLIGIIIGVVGIFSQINLFHHEQQAYSESTLGIKYTSQAETNLLKTSSMLRDLYIYYDNESSRNALVQQISSKMSSMESQLSSVKVTVIDSKGAQDYDDLLTSYQDFKDTVDTLLKACNDNESSENILKLITDSAGGASNAQFRFDTMMQYNTQKAESQLASDKKSAVISVVAMAIITILSFIASLFLSRYISKRISDPLQMLAGLSENLAVGDIDIQDKVTEADQQLKYRKDEIGKVASSFNNLIAATAQQAKEMKAIANGDLTTAVTVRSEKDVIGNSLTNLKSKFHALAASIVTSADQVDSGAKQVADFSMSLSQGSTEQAGSIEELRASLDEITLQTAQNAQNAKTADNLARGIRGDAEKGTVQMTDMLQAMSQIQVSSESIGKVIKVIEDIAFQTNILALNAAVEAARAGQYGRSFAVVAEEVRNLASKSSEAAKETTDLIENSVNSVSSGTKIANETAAALDKIVAGVNEATDLISSISAASTEQAATLEQITQGIVQVSDVVQSNAAASEECAAASEELSSQADCLKESVSVFKLNA